LKKIKSKTVIKSFLKRLLYPRHFVKYIRLSKKRKSPSRAELDTQLKLYAEILPGDFLHYGYFENPDVKPENIALADIQQAQLRYAERIVDGVKNKNTPVLDVGCGTGGLINLLLQKGHKVVGLTPDRYQVQYIQQKYPDAELIHNKFQNIDSEKYAQNFGTVINSESLQYIKPEKAFELVDKILQPGGRWIIVDYFRTDVAHEKSGHKWKQFTELVKNYKLSTLEEYEITSNIYPTLAFIHMWGEKLGLPLFEFLVGKLKRKSPKLHYLLDEILSDFHTMAKEKLEIVNPETFIRNKKYMFIILEKPE